MNTFYKLSAGLCLTGTLLLAGCKSQIEGSIDGGVDPNTPTAVRWVFTVQPTNTSPSTAITPDIRVEARDANNNVVTTYTAPVTLSFQTDPSTNAVMGGTTTQYAIAGVAIFDGITIDNLSNGYILKASDSFLFDAQSQAFNVTGAGVPAKLAFNVHPANTANHQTISPDVEVQILDTFDNLVATATDTVTLAIQIDGATGSTLSGTVSVAAVNGVATFNNLSIDKVGTGFKLRASSGTLTTVDSNAFNITPGVAAKLAFTQQPQNTENHDTIFPSLTIEIRDSYDNLVTAATSGVTLAIQTDPSASATLSGTTTVNAVAGIATFNDLSIDKIGTGYILRATSGALTLADSNAFNILAGAVSATTSTIVGSGPKIADGVDVSTITITLLDSNSSPVAGVTPTFSATDTGTTNNYGVCSSSDASGVSVCALASTKAEVKTLSLVTPVSKVGGTVTFTNGPASQIVFTTQPSSLTVATVAIATQPVLTIRDAFANVVTTGVDSTATVTISTSTGTGTPSGTTSMAAVAGVADFASKGLSYTLGGDKVLLATKADTSGSGGTNSVTATSNTIYIEPAQFVTAAGQHSCAVVSGAVKCWGSNIYGELGNGTTTESHTPVSVTGITTAVSVTAGPFHSCALLSDRTIKCWGQNTVGQLGDGTTTSSTTPVTVSGISNAVAISASTMIFDAYWHTCAKLSDLTVKCWGLNGAGQLGDGTTTNRSTPVAVGSLTNVKMMAAGQQHTCAVLTDGTGMCWGNNALGQLGNGSTTTSAVTSPVTISGLSNAIAISAGGGHSCAALSDGTVKCWGTNNQNVLGNVAGTSYTPQVVTGLTNTIALTSGRYHQCALISDGTVKCWGMNDAGQCGGFVNINSTTPVTVAGVSNAVSISTSNEHTCAQISDGTIKCWGGNGGGQMGIGSFDNAFTSTAHGSLSNVTGISTNISHSCVTLSDGTGQCCGYGQANRLGTGGATLNFTAPQAISGLASATANLSTGQAHGCSIMTTGSIKCWGYGTSGQLGDGTTTTRNNANTAVSGITTATKVVTGSTHSCALLTGGAVSCWGSANVGQVGDGGTTTRTSPVSTGITDATDIAAGTTGSHTCAVVGTGSVKCWGLGTSGQLGNGGITTQSSPVSVAGITTATSLALSDTASCALLSDATVKCWGQNTYGMVGDGTSTNRSAPVTVTGLTGVSKIFAGLNNVCAVLSDGTAKCWGHNQYGQIGIGSMSYRVLSPTVVTGLTNVTSMGVGNTICALISGGTVKCAGRSTSAQGAAVPSFVAETVLNIP